MSEGPTFAPRLVAAIAVCAAIAFAFSLLLQLRGTGEDMTVVQPSTYSHSAIGHAGLYEILRRLDFPVARGGHDASAGLGRGGVMVLAEPDLDFSSIDNIAFKSAPTILLVLPKRRGDPAADRTDWIGHAELLDLGPVRLALRLLVADGDVIRKDAPKSWTKYSLGPLPELGAPVQLVRSAKLRPIIASGNDILLGEMRDGRQRIVVLADPDPIENHMKHKQIRIRQATYKPTR